MIRAGIVPPVVVAMPDGSIDGEKGKGSPSSFFMNGVNGRFEDHIIQEIIPFLQSNYSIRPERQAHAIAGGSAGGFAALSIAIRYRQFFGMAATLNAPVNMLYDTRNEDPRADFDPSTYQWQEEYHPRQIVGQFLCGLYTSRVEDFFEPATLLLTSNLQPGELAIYLNYGALDEFNFDAHAESFAWLAAQQGIAVTVHRDPRGRHNRPYFRRNQRYAFSWIGSQILPPIPRTTSVVPPTP